MYQVQSTLYLGSDGPPIPHKPSSVLIRNISRVLDFIYVESGLYVNIFFVLHEPGCLSTFDVVLRYVDGWLLEQTGSD
jgi:hypothetical protein